MLGLSANEDKQLTPNPLPFPAGREREPGCVSLEVPPRLRGGILGWGQHVKCQIPNRHLLDHPHVIHTSLQRPVWKNAKLYPAFSC